MIKRYYIATIAALQSVPVPNGYHAHNMSDGVHAVVVTQDLDFGNGGLPPGWIGGHRILSSTPLPPAVVTLLAPDYGVVTGDTLLIAAFKIMLVHLAFDPET